MADIKRIGVGSDKYPSVKENDLKVPAIFFDFSTNEITFDQQNRTFDENPNE